MRPRTIAAVPAEPAFEPGVVVEPEPEPEPVVEPEPDPKPVVDPEPEPVVDPEPVVEPEPEPKPKPEPEPVVGEADPTSASAPDPAPTIDGQEAPDDHASLWDEDVVFSPEVAGFGRLEDFVHPDDADSAWTIEPPPRAPTSRRRWRAGVAVAVIVVAAAIAAAGFAFLARDDAPKDTPTTTARSADPPALVRSFCDDPRALGDRVAAFTPGQIAVGFAPIPAPASSTVAATEVVLQVSPEVGTPDLRLDPSVALVSVGICLSEASSKATGTACRYELTNPDDLGDHESSKLRAVTYDATAYALRTGERLASGPISSTTDSCPTFAFTDGPGVSNPISGDQIGAWVGTHLPGGIPE